MVVDRSDRVASCLADLDMVRSSPSRGGYPLASAGKSDERAVGAWA